MTTQSTSLLQRLLESLRAMPSRPGLLNPYHSVQGEEMAAAHEEVGNEADQVRTRNLLAYLGALVEAGSDVILCGEAPGYQGCRFSGIAFTSERELLSGGFPFEGCTLLPGAATRQRPLMKEPSALYVWRALRRSRVPAVLWNAVQCHPHEPGKPLTNRTPTREEVHLGQESLSILVELVRPRMVVALGKTAERALRDLGVDAHGVRHPSYGGASTMLSQLEELGVIGPAPPDPQQGLF